MNPYDGSSIRVKQLPNSRFLIEAYMQDEYNEVPVLAYSIETLDLNIVINELVYRTGDAKLTNILVEKMLEYKIAIALRSNGEVVPFMVPTEMRAGHA
jgi:hypothetical protein